MTADANHVAVAELAWRLDAYGVDERAIAAAAVAQAKAARRGFELGMATRHLRVVDQKAFGSSGAPDQKRLIVEQDAAPDVVRMRAVHEVQPMHPDGATRLSRARDRFDDRHPRSAAAIVALQSPNISLPSRLGATVPRARTSL